VAPQAWGYAGLHTTELTLSAAEDMAEGWFEGNCKVATICTHGSTFNRV
jgi:hypothetical protein